MTRGLWIDMARHQRHGMTRTTAAGIAGLLLTVLLLPFVSGADSTVTVNTTWSGQLTLTGNVTVASGATLTVEPGTAVDALSLIHISEPTRPY